MAVVGDGFGEENGSEEDDESSDAGESVRVSAGSPSVRGVFLELLKPTFPRLRSPWFRQNSAKLISNSELVIERIGT